MCWDVLQLSISKYSRTCDYHFYQDKLSGDSLKTHIACFVADADLPFAILGALRSTLSWSYVIRGLTECKSNDMQFRPKFTRFLSKRKSTSGKWFWNMQIMFLSPPILSLCQTTSHSWQLLHIWLQKTLPWRTTLVDFPKMKVGWVFFEQ